MSETAYRITENLWCPNCGDRLGFEESFVVDDGPGQIDAEVDLVLCRDGDHSICGEFQTQKTAFEIIRDDHGRPEVRGFEKIEFGTPDGEIDYLAGVEVRFGHQQFRLGLDNSGRVREDWEVVLHDFGGRVEELPEVDPHRQPRHPSIEKGIEHLDQACDCFRDVETDLTVAERHILNRIEDTAGELCDVSTALLVEIEGEREAIENE